MSFALHMSLHTFTHTHREKIDRFQYYLKKKRYELFKKEINQCLRYLREA